MASLWADHKTLENSQDVDMLHLRLKREGIMLTTYMAWHWLYDTCRNAVVTWLATGEAAKTWLEELAYDVKIVLHDGQTTATFTSSTYMLDMPVASFSYSNNSYAKYPRGSVLDQGVVYWVLKILASWFRFPDSVSRWQAFFVSSILAHIGRDALLLTPVWTAYTRVFSAVIRRSRSMSHVTARFRLLDTQLREHPLSRKGSYERQLLDNFSSTVNKIYDPALADVESATPTTQILTLPTSKPALNPHPFISLPITPPLSPLQLARLDDFVKFITEAAQVVLNRDDGKPSKWKAALTRFPDSLYPFRFLAPSLKRAYEPGGPYAGSDSAATFYSALTFRGVTFNSELSRHGRLLYRDHTDFEQACEEFAEEYVTATGARPPAKAYCNTSAYGPSNLHRTIQLAENGMVMDACPLRAVGTIDRDARRAEHRLCDGGACALPPLRNFPPLPWGQTLTRSHDFRISSSSLSSLLSVTATTPPTCGRSFSTLPGPFALVLDRLRSNSTSSPLALPSHPPSTLSFGLVFRVFRSILELVSIHLSIQLCNKMTSSSSAPRKSTRLTEQQARRPLPERWDDGDEDLPEEVRKKPKQRVPKTSIYKDDHVHPRHIGLFNKRNTCFVNSKLQVLFGQPAFTNGLINHPDNCAKIDCCSCAYKASFKQMQQSTEPAIRPSDIWHAWKDIFYGAFLQDSIQSDRQEDCHEVFREVFGKIHDENRTFDDDGTATSFLEDFAGGELSSTVRCTVCQQMSGTPSVEPILDLSVPLENPAGHVIANVQDALNEFFAQENIDYRCARCGSANKAEKYLQVSMAPNTLFVHLKRFATRRNKKTGATSLKKLDHNVGIPGILDLTHLTVNAIPTTYSLSAYITHVGGDLASGHYTATAKRGTRWFCFDDEHVTELTPQAVVNHEQAYILVYTKNTCIPSTSSTSSIRGADYRAHDALVSEEVATSPPASQDKITAVSYENPAPTGHSQALEVIDEAEDTFYHAQESFQQSTGPDDENDDKDLDIEDADYICDSRSDVETQTWGEADSITGRIQKCPKGQPFGAEYFERAEDNYQRRLARWAEAIGDPTKYAETVREAGREKAPAVFAELWDELSALLFEETMHQASVRKTLQLDTTALDKLKSIVTSWLGATCQEHIPDASPTWEELPPDVLELCLALASDPSQVDLAQFKASGTLAQSFSTTAPPHDACAYYLRFVFGTREELQQALLQYLDAYPTDAPWTVLQLVMLGMELDDIEAHMRTGFIRHGLDGVTDQLFATLRASLHLPSLHGPRRAAKCMVYPVETYRVLGLQTPFNGSSLDMRTDARFSEKERILISILGHFRLNSAAGGILPTFKADDATLQLIRAAQSIVHAQYLLATQSAPSTPLPADTIASLVRLLDDQRTIAGQLSLPPISDKAYQNIHRFLVDELRSVSHQVLRLDIGKDIPREAHQGVTDGYWDAVTGDGPRQDRHLRRILNPSQTANTHFPPRTNFWPMSLKLPMHSLHAMLLSRVLRCLKPLVLFTHSAIVSSALRDGHVTAADHTFAAKGHHADKALLDGITAEEFLGDVPEDDPPTHQHFIRHIGTMEVVQNSSDPTNLSIHVPSGHPGRIKYDPRIAPLLCTLKLFALLVAQLLEQVVHGLLITHPPASWTDATTIRLWMQDCIQRTTDILVSSGVQAQLDVVRARLERREMVLGFMRALVPNQRRREEYLASEPANDGGFFRGGALASEHEERDAQLKYYMRVARSQAVLGLNPDPFHLAPYRYPILSPAFSEWFQKLKPGINIVAAANALGRTAAGTAAAIANQQAFVVAAANAVRRHKAEAHRNDKHRMMIALRSLCRRKVHVPGDIRKSMRVAACHRPGCGWTGVATCDKAEHDCTKGSPLIISDTHFERPMERMTHVHDVLHDTYMLRALGNVDDVLDELGLFPIPVESVLANHCRRVQAKMHKDDFAVLERLPPSTRDIYVHWQDLDDDEWKTILAIDVKLKQHHDEDSDLHLHLEERFTPVQTRQRTGWTKPRGKDWLFEWFTKRKTTLHSSCCRGPSSNLTPHVYLTDKAKTRTNDDGTAYMGTDNTECNYCSGKYCSEREWRLVRNAFQLPYHYVRRLWLHAHGLVQWSERVGKKKSDAGNADGTSLAKTAGNKGKGNIGDANGRETTKQKQKGNAREPAQTSKKRKAKRSDDEDENTPPKKKPKRASAKTAESENGTDKKQVGKRKNVSVDDAEVAQTRKKRKT
uniref:ubiquitinyl hydrolase 1 n=1 Tax=Mycena chlorophos TaxID=658473 RepID=A0ABQ0L1M4_MYCCL|nr:cysteine proteinase [Mycena chlorophos]